MRRRRLTGPPCLIPLAAVMKRGPIRGPPIINDPIAIVKEASGRKCSAESVDPEFNTKDTKGTKNTKRTDNQAIASVDQRPQCLVFMV